MDQSSKPLPHDTGDCSLIDFQECLTGVDRFRSASRVLTRGTVFRLPSILHPYCGSGEGIGLLRTPTVVLRGGADSPSHFPASSPLGQARRITLRSALKPRWDPA